VLVDQLRFSETRPLELVWPSDPRARRVAERARATLSEPLDAARLVEGSGASLRTIERLFRRETGTTLERWRVRLRALEALRGLARGDSVTETALAVGYRGTSAFVAMFRRTLGVPPGRYFRDGAGGATGAGPRASSSAGSARSRSAS